MPQGKGSQMHNRRDYEKYDKPIPDNIDVSKISKNVILVDKDIREAYREIFSEALAKYNSKQKRADRKIEDYYDHIQKSKNGEKLFYEDVVQWGSKEDFQNSEIRQKAKEALVKYVAGFEERNPNLKLIGAYIHMDEASPHLHLDYIPVATGYSRGLEKRNSLDKAMKQMGFQPEKESRKNNATKLWKENERAVFGQICRGLGLEVEAERKARGSLSVEEYKEARAEMIGEIERERNAIVAEVVSAKQRLECLRQRTEKETAEVASLDQAIEQAKHQSAPQTVGESVRTLLKARGDAEREESLRSQIRELEKANRGANEREESLRGQISELDKENQRARERVEELDRELPSLREHNQSLGERFDDLVRAIEKTLERVREIPNTLSQWTQDIARKLGVDTFNPRSPDRLIRKARETSNELNRGREVSRSSLGRKNSAR